jgi:NADH-quinone oxidoreductase subunit J
MTLTILAFALSGLLMAGGAAVVALTKDLMRMVIGLGAFLIGVAGMFLFYGQAFLATAQIFVYVGGVLVLVVFAVMVVHRSTGGRPVLESRHDVGAAAIAFGVAGMVIMSLRDSVGGWLPASAPGGAMIAEELLGGHLVVFELLGTLLLAALVAVLVIVGAGERR